jgi:hypothetical protein
MVDAVVNILVGKCITLDLELELRSSMVGKLVIYKKRQCLLLG